ncbi:MAG: hypothetical protein ABI811_01710 [Acidobacteriota bacterium]
MRLGRIILLASLAQILGFTTLAAALSEHPALIKALGSPEHGQAWKSFLQAPDTDVALHSVVRERPSSQAVLALTALAATPLRHSLWMVTPAVRTTAVPRPRQFILLRC